MNRALPSGESFTPLQDLDGIISPADLHFERHHAGIPAVDPDRYSPLIHECFGNGIRSWRRITKELSPQDIDGMTSTSDWIGVPLATLFPGSRTDDEVYALVAYLLHRNEITEIR